MEFSEFYKPAADALMNAQKILMVSHRRPDGDTLGAVLGLHFFLKKLGKETTLACVDEPSNRFMFLPEIEKYQRSFEYRGFDLIVICDAGDSKMTGFHESVPDFLSNKIPILNIDHHISNDNFGTWNLVEPTSASATMVVYKLIKYMKGEFTPEVALCLMTGFYNDTGSFMHSNATLEIFQAAAELMKTNIDVSVIAKHMFRKKTYSQLKLWGLILERLKMNHKKVISSVLTLHDIHAIGASSDDTGGIIDIISTVREADFSALIAEDEKGFVKGSFRTQKNDVDVAEIAGQFGGGGHKKAAGFRIPGRLRQEMVWRIETPESGHAEASRTEIRF